MPLSTPEGPITPCTSSAEGHDHPYYFVAAGYRHADPKNRLLHRLCSWLNHAGHESWIITTDTHTKLWTPRLQDNVRAQHHAGNKCPIVVFCDEKLVSAAQLGTKVHYRFNIFSEQSTVAPQNDAAIFSWTGAQTAQQLRLPFLNLPSHADAVGVSDRSGCLVFADRYLAIGGATRDLPPDATRLTAADLLDEDALAAQLSKSATLYLYEPSVLSIVARAHGCAVVHIKDVKTWPEGLDDRNLGTHGLTEARHWQDSQQVKTWSAQAFLAEYCDHLKGWEYDLAHFVECTQLAASHTPMDKAWPEEVVLSLPPMEQDMQALARRADKIKQLRVNQQLAKWNERSTLREIDGEIYGGHVASGKLPALAAVVYADEDTNALADTLDSLGNSLLQPSELTIVSSQPSPFGDGQVEGMVWVQLPPDWLDLAALPAQTTGPLAHIQAPWVMTIKAGASFQPNCLLEFAITARDTTATVLYADDDVIVEGKPQYPHFKPHTNVEWLRSTNYLGDAVLLQTRAWKKHPENHRFEGVYAFALRALETQGKTGLCHLDTLLVHGSGQLSDTQLAAEQAQVQAHLARLQLKADVQPGSQRGLRLIAYAADAQRVSMVVPCATQTGYLGCLLQSMATHFSPLLHEVLVVADHDFAERVQQAVNEATVPFGVRVVAIANQPYSHARALNAGASQATGNVLLFADDDTEVVHSGWLEPLCGLFAQGDVAGVAPRLLRPGSPDPVICAGPVFLGLGGLMTAYCGEAGNVLESGPYGRMQAAQDVSAFASHFFLVNARHFKLLGGFDEATFPLVLPVVDFALRANAKGLRHVWSPQVSVLHQGGKTLEEQKRLPENVLAMHQSELRERRSLVARWTQALGSDPCYNRNLSLAHPFDLEQDIVIDWQTSRKDRPRAVALPLSSGSGQYRVIEPLNALQDEGRAQSCVVFPINRDVARVPTSIELVRSGLDRLVVQNAIGDLQLARMEEYRVNIPGLGIIHMLDDLFGNLPGKHHLHNYHKREGNARLRRSLELSDRLVVTTEPLKDYYEAFVAETRVIPNSLVESTWFDLPVTRRERKGKLRVGWAGAQQHLGDLDMIQAVVAHFGQAVDWVFMGMCPPSVQPHVKEVHPFVSINVYPQTLANLDLDIAIAPLEDNHFNTCKSNLRLLEYGAMGWPVVCSDVYPFRTDDPPVMRVSNDAGDWISALEKLIDSENLRSKLGSQLNHWVKTRYALGVHTDAWFNAIFDPIKR